MERHFTQTQSTCFLSSVYPCLLAVSWIELTNDTTKGHKHVGPTAEISRSLQWTKLSHNEKGATYTIFVHGTDHPTCKWIRIFMWVYKSQGILCMHFFKIHIYCTYIYIYTFKIHKLYKWTRRFAMIICFFHSHQDTKMVATSHHRPGFLPLVTWWPLVAPMAGWRSMRRQPDIWEETLLETNISLWK